ncbi:MAG: dihydrolipoyl dehydrogenase [Gammaproteobacteria bacterium]|nr:dihydrolipoyl dehydrogenase [Gammaproteobacteria bacterium]MDH5801670.1 dihydrolipoyl dehydrogenase [Gammaproteobacteria bacterium]
MADYDVVVIGGGPGGYVAAIRCAQLGMKTVCVDAWQNEQGQSTLGGVCLNVGCIPSKALLDSSHHYHSMLNEFKHHGIEVNKHSLKLDVMMRRKDQIVESLTAGISTLFAKNKVDWIKGHGRLLSNSCVEVVHHDSKSEVTELNCNHIIIATGSTPTESSLAPFDDDLIVDSSGALSFSEVPKNFGVIGAGVIGLELGSVWSRLGAKTTILNRGNKFLKSVDRQIARAAKKELESQGLNIQLGVKIKKVEKTSVGAVVHYHQEDKEHKLEVDKLLVATGRTPNSANINADSVGLHINQRGFIEVDEQCRTNLQGVYAIGDVVRGPMLAHKASEEGVVVAERIAGQSPEIDFTKVPWVIYTAPEIAWVGRSAEQLDDRGVKYKTGIFPFAASGRSLAMGSGTGMVKVLADAETDRILGVHIFGPSASELIGEAVLAMEFFASAEDLARTIHAHPSLSEALHEAAMAAEGRAIHI